MLHANYKPLSDRKEVAGVQWKKLRIHIMQDSSTSTGESKYDTSKLKVSYYLFFSDVKLFNILDPTQIRR